MDQRTLRARGLLATTGLLLGHLGVSALLLWGTRGALSAVRAPGPAPVDASVALAAAAAAWAMLSWLTAVTVLAVLTAALTGLGSQVHRRAAALAPAGSRRLVAALLGLTFVGIPLAAGQPAGAAQSAPPVASAAPQPAGAAAPAGAGGGPRSLDRPAPDVPDGWTPDRPAAPTRRSDAGTAPVRLVASTPRAEDSVTDEVVVRRGDTLWDIAARHLGPHATADEVAAEWPRWYRANRVAIGHDPDLLLAGQRLHPPSGR